MNFITLGLLAGAYRGGRASLQNMLTHSVQYFENDIDDWVGEYTLCGKISLDHVADTNSNNEGDLELIPTCFKCAQMDPRFK